MMLKRRRILTLFLAFALALSLALPAAAFEDTDPPMWKEWGYDSLEDFMVWNNLETYEDYLAYIEDYSAAWQEYEDQESRWQDWRGDYLAAHPDFRKEALSNKQEVLKNWGFSDEKEFYDWYGFESQTEFEDFIIDSLLRPIYYKEDQAHKIQEEKLALGGPLEGVGVFWQTAYVPFPDAKPEIHNDRTMIPIRAFMELVGAQVAFGDSDRSVTLTLKNGDVLRFAVGSTDVTLSKGTEVRSLKMDVAPYIKADRTYVPVRFFSEVLGYDVRWDADYQTAVILDRAAIIKELNQNFTLINKMLSQSSVDMNKTYKTTSDISMNLTLMDSISGNKSGRASGSFTVRNRGYAIDATGSMDMTSLLKTLVPDPVEYESNGLKALEKMDFEYVGDLTQGGLYFYSKAYSQLLGDTTGTAWMYMPFDVMNSALLTMDPTMGHILYEVYSASGVSSYGDMKYAAETLATIMGDSKFTKVGSDQQLTVTAEQMDKLLFSELGYGLSGIEELSFTLRVKPSGAYSSSFSMVTSSSGQVPKMSMTMTMTESATDASAEMEIHIQNYMQLKMNVTARTKETSETLRSAPPADAPIIDLSEYMDMDAIGTVFSALQAATLIK